MLLFRSLILLFVTGSLAFPAAGGETLDRIRERGYLNCGVPASLPGFSIETENGRQGFFVDLCRAIAIASLGDPSQVRLVTLTEDNNQSGLQSGKVDLMMSLTPWQMMDDTALGLTFVTPTFYDSLQILASTGQYLTKDLTNQTLCFNNQPDRQASLERLSQQQNLSLKLAGFPSLATAIKAYDNGQCQALAGRVSELIPLLASLSKPQDSHLLPESFEVSATGIWISQGDEDWFKLIRWTFQWLLNAEQQDLRGAAADDTNNQAALVSAAILLGLSEDWQSRILQQLGHYGDIFERHLGQASPYAMPRGHNNLIDNGGLLVPARMN